MSGLAPSSVSPTGSATALGESDDPRWVGLLLRLSMASALAVMLIGLGALAGWALEMPALRSLLPRWGSMAPNAALAFALAGAALLALQWRRYSPARRLSQLLALLLLLISLATLLQYLTGQDYGIDQRLFQDSSHSVLTLHSARMAPITAFNLALAGAALLLLGTNHSALRSPAQALALLVFVGAYLGGITFLQSGSALFGLAAYAGIATYTLIAFVLLAVGLLCAAPTQGWTAPLVSSTAGGRMIRRTLPYALIGPAVLAWLGHAGQTEGLYGQAFGGALFALVMMLLFCGLIWWTGLAENQADRERQRLLAERLGLEERFRYLFEDLPLGLALSSADGRVQVNPALCRILGYREPELIARDWRTLAHPDDVPGNQALLDQFNSGATDAIRFTSRYRQQTGALVWAEVNMALHREADGRSSYVLATITDISEQKAAEAKLWHSELRYRRLFEAAQDGILILDGDTGAIIDANPFLTDLLGLAREALLGKMLWQIGVFDDIAASKLAFAELERQGYIRYEDLQLRAKDGRHLDVEFISNRYRLNGGSVYQCNIRDISDRKRAEQKVGELQRSLERRIKERTAQLESAVKDLEGFSYSVSHDLRAPLRAIDNFSAILLEEEAGKLGAEGQRLLGIIRGNATKMEQLIADILAFSRAGRQELSLALVDMTALAREVYDELRADCPERAIDFQLADLPPVQADSTAIRQVWVNLLANAIKFSRGRAPARITVSGVVDGGECRYTLRDNGAGFDPKYAHKLFGVFQRLHTTEQFEGSGIGLAIVKRFLDKHGGRVWAEGVPGEGAVFHFALPAPEAVGVQPS